MPAIVRNAREYPHRLIAFIGMLTIFATIPLSGVAVYHAVNTRNLQAKAAEPTIDISGNAVQKPHTNAVPHVDVSGNFRNQFSSDSFLPIGIYNPVLCKVTKSLSWTPRPGYSGDYRIKINYGSSRAVGSYLLADINVGTGTNNRVVGNLPPSTNLYYSVWLNGSTTVVTEGAFRSDACSNTAENNNFESIRNAGYNVGILEKNVFPDLNYLTKAQQSALKLILDMRDRPNNTFASLKDNQNIFGFYVGDDDLAKARFYNTDTSPGNNVDVNGVYTNIRDYANSLDLQTNKVVLAAEPDVEAGAGAEWLNWYNQFDSIGNVSFHYNYPKSPSLGFNSIKTVVDTVKHQVTKNGSDRPSWFISQAINLKWVIGLDFPTATESRAMKFAAIVHGATGIFDFSYDGWFRRQPKGSPAPENQNDINWYDRHAGVKANTPASYSGGDKWAYSASTTEQSQSTGLWNGLDASKNGVNKQIHQLKPVILSKTLGDDYKVFVDKTPSYSPTPIRTILKSYQGNLYLIAVNINNESVNTKIQLTGKNVNKAEVMFENRNAPITGGNEIIEAFGPFDVNIYKIQLNNPALDAMVKSQRQVCSLYGSEQSAAGIGGQDGGTSLKLGADSIWTFGDSTNTSGGLFLPNNAAKTTDTDAGDCISLIPKKSGSTAVELYPKASWELLSWPDGMVNVSGGNAHFYYMSVRGCNAPEQCAYQPLGSWKVRGIGLGRFDSSMAVQRVGSCGSFAGCLLWQETDNNGFEIAGATAAVDGDYVYVFLNESLDGVYQGAVRLARVAKASVESKGAYQYYNGTAWVSNIRDSQPVMTFPGGFNGASVAFNSFLGKWTAIYTTNNFSAVAMKTADNITGPWSAEEKIIMDCNSVYPADSELKCYFGRQHSEFSKDGGRIIYVSYTNQNTYRAYLHEIEFVGANSELPVGKYRAEYFNNTDFTDKVLTREEDLARITLKGSSVMPVPELSADSTFAVRWEGKFQMTGGKYRFNSNSSGHVAKIYVDDELKIEGTLMQNALVDISSGEHRVKVEFIKSNPATNYAIVTNFFDRTVCYDLTGDSVVNSVDQLNLGQNFLKRGETPWDLNGDQVVNSLDQLILAQKFNIRCPYPVASPSSSPVPSPSPSPSPTPSPVAQACSINPGTVTKGSSINLSVSGFNASNLSVSVIGAFGTPLYQLGTLNGTTATFTIPAEAQNGLYRARVGLESGTFIYCTPDLSIN